MRHTRLRRLHRRLAKPWTRQPDSINGQPCRAPREERQGDGAERAAQLLPDLRLAGKAGESVCETRTVDPPKRCRTLNNPKGNRKQILKSYTSPTTLMNCQALQQFLTSLLLAL